MRRSVSFSMLILAASLAQAATINLTGTIRDFKGRNEVGGHPDFEGVIGGVQTGQVAPVLGSDGLPAFLNPPKPGFTNATNFDQWWRNNSFNQRSTSTITLDDAGHPGIFTFADNSFFPIDGMLFGNTPGFPRNYHFTYQISTTFSFTGGETFTFTGDDDLYVFLNGQLAIDIGGVHSSASRTITLSPGDFGMAAGQNYAFDLFFAERHTTQSNFRIDTTLGLRDNQAGAATPEPSSFVLLGAGLVVLGFRRRWKSSIRERSRLPKSCSRALCGGENM